MAWALVQDNDGHTFSTSTSSILVQFDGIGGAGPNATIGNLLVGVVGWSGTATISSITDSGTGATNSWDSVIYNNGSGWNNALIWCVNARDTLTLSDATINLSVATTYWCAMGREYSGSHASPADGSDAQHGSFTAGTDVIQSPYKTPTWNGDLIIGFGDGPSNTTSAGTGFGNFRIGAADAAQYMADLVQTSAASVRAVFSSSGSGNYNCGVAAFKASDGTPAGGTAGSISATRVYS